MIRPLITACGVLAIFVSSVTSLPQPAYLRRRLPHSGFVHRKRRADWSEVIKLVESRLTPHQIRCKMYTDYEHTEKVFDNVSKCKVLKDTGEVKEVAFTIRPWKFDDLRLCPGNQINAGRIEWKRLSVPLRRTKASGNSSQQRRKSDTGNLRKIR